MPDPISLCFAWRQEMERAIFPIYRVNFSDKKSTSFNLIRVDQPEYDVARISRSTLENEKCKRKASILAADVVQF